MRIPATWHAFETGITGCYKRRRQFPVGKFESLIFCIKLNPSTDCPEICHSVD